MDWWLILLRIVHVGSAMAWFGGAIVSSFFLAPTAQALGAAGQPFMDHLMRRRIGIFFPVVSALTILIGAALYWRASNGLDGAWIGSGPGLAFTIGGLAALAAFIGGAVLIGPSIGEQTRPCSLSWQPAAASRPRRSASGWLEQRERCALQIGSTCRCSCSPASRWPSRATCRHATAYFA